MLAATFLALLSAWDPARPCADSTEAEQDFWQEASWGAASPEPCDVEESLLFPAAAPSSPRTSERAAFSVERRARSSGGGLATTTRHQARRSGWSHRLEVRDGMDGEAGERTLSRRELSWSGEGWKIAGGDLVDEDLAAWPRGLPRRALPSGWRPARAGEPFAQAASPRLQGLAAGVSHPRWSAYGLSAWNPVESGREPPWSKAWTLTHSVAGLSLDVPARGDAPWRAALHLSETRIARGDADSLSERLAAARLASPHEDFALFAAMLETSAGTRAGTQAGTQDGTKAKARASPAWALGIDAKRRFAARAREFAGEASLRQRGAAWLSAWDPAVPKNPETAAGAWGAGEYRLAATLRLDEALSMRAENWRSWHPAEEAWRKGARARVERHLDDFRLDLGATWRASRAASGSVSAYRALEAEGFTLGNPRWRARAARAWNAEGSVSMGLFLGVEPDWNDWRAHAGCQVEADRRDRLKGTASGGFTWKFARGWDLDAGGALPWPRAEEGRWRATVHFNLSGASRASSAARDREIGSFEPERD